MKLKQRNYLQYRHVNYPVSKYKYLCFGNIVETPAGVESSIPEYAVNRRTLPPLSMPPQPDIPPITYGTVTTENPVKKQRRKIKVK